MQVLFILVQVVVQLEKFYVLSSGSGSPKHHLLCTDMLSLFRIAFSLAPPSHRNRDRQIGCRPCSPIAPLTAIGY